MGGVLRSSGSEDRRWGGFFVLRGSKCRNPDFLGFGKTTVFERFMGGSPPPLSGRCRGVHLELAIQRSPSWACVFRMGVATCVFDTDTKVLGLCRMTEALVVQEHPPTKRQGFPQSNLTTPHLQWGVSHISDGGARRARGLKLFCRLQRSSRADSYSSGVDFPHQTEPPQSFGPVFLPQVFELTRELGRSGRRWPAAIGTNQATAHHRKHKAPRQIGELTM